MKAVIHMNHILTENVTLNLWSIQEVQREISGEISEVISERTFQHAVSIGSPL